MTNEGSRSDIAIQRIQQAKESLLSRCWNRTLRSSQVANIYGLYFEPNVAWAVSELDSFDEVAATASAFFAIP